jgi:hypothetical protein
VSDCVYYYRKWSNTPGWPKLRSLYSMFGALSKSLSHSNSRRSSSKRVGFYGEISKLFYSRPRLTAHSQKAPCHGDKGATSNKNNTDDRICLVLLTFKKVSVFMSTKAVDIWLHSSLTLALCGGQWQTSCPGLLALEVRTCHTDWAEDWVDRRASLDVLEKKKYVGPVRKLNPHRLSVT